VRVGDEEGGERVGAWALAVEADVDDGTDGLVGAFGVTSVGAWSDKVGKRYTRVIGRSALMNHTEAAAR
jgi:hypothetical protein